MKNVTVLINALSSGFLRINDEYKNQRIVAIIPLENALVLKLSLFICDFLLEKLFIIFHIRYPTENHSAKIRPLIILDFPDFLFIKNEYDIHKAVAINPNKNIYEFCNKFLSFIIKIIIIYVNIIN